MKKQNSIRKLPQQMRAKESRNRILHAATELFSKHGFDETTTIKIAKRAGVSIGTIYVHFTDKYEIFREIMENFYKSVYQFEKDAVNEMINVNHDIDLAAVIEGFVFRLYESNHLNGKLSQEINRFVMINKRAFKILEHWRKIESIELTKVLEHFNDRFKIDDLKVFSVIMQIMLGRLFTFLFENKKRVDEKVYIQTFLEMIKGVIKSE